MSHLKAPLLLGSGTLVENHLENGYNCQIWKNRFSGWLGICLLSNGGKFYRLKNNVTIGFGRTQK